jgi:hypothetical protein
LVCVTDTFRKELSHGLGGLMLAFPVKEIREQKRITDEIIAKLDTERLISLG